jgi:Bacterial Ig-like domain (group 3)
MGSAGSRARRGEPQVYQACATFWSIVSLCANCHAHPRFAAFWVSLLRPPVTVTLTATVIRSASGAAGTPTGSITFSTEGITLATVKLNSKGVAAITASSNGYPAGKYPITAKYSGDASDAASTSSSVTVTVK